MTVAAELGMHPGFAGPSHKHSKAGAPLGVSGDMLAVKLK